MTTEQNTQRSFNHTDRDYLELLMHKLNELGRYRRMYFSNTTMQSNKHFYESARNDVNQFITLLRKRGYSGARFEGNEPKQRELWG